jgi:hypothetical protein
MRKEMKRVANVSKDMIRRDIPSRQEGNENVWGAKSGWGGVRCWVKVVCSAPLEVQ